MYLEHFGLNVNPFGLSPKLDFLYRSSAFEESMAHLVYGLDNSEAIVLITGSIGTGKTMAVQSFLSHLGSHFAFALVTNTRVNSVELLKLILDDLGVSFPVGSDKSDLLILFKEFLLDSSRAGKKVLLVVDEAQNLSRDVLEEVRLLTNLGQGEGQPVQIILLGQPELEVLLDREDLAQLKQRIRVHYRLGFLTREELDGYLAHRMSVAGCDENVFSRGAVDRIDELSGGVPRVVNTVAGEALLSAFVAGHKRVEVGDVELDDGPPVVTLPRSDPPRTDPIETASSNSGQIVEERGHAPEAKQAVERVRPTMAVRTGRTRARSARGLIGWMIAVLVLLIVGAAYIWGYLDPTIARVTAALFRSPQQVTVQTDTSTEGLISRPEQEGSRPAAQDSDSLNTVTDRNVSETAPALGEHTAPLGTVAVSVNASGALATASYFVHISSFKTIDRAEAMVSRLSAKGMAAVERRHLVNGVEWFRVYIGPFGDHELARIRANELLDSGQISYYKIVQLDPANDS